MHYMVTARRNRVRPRPLFQQRHAFGFGIPLVTGHPVQIHTGGYRLPLCVTGVPGHGVLTGLQNLVDQGHHFLTEEVVDHQPDRGLLGNLVGDFCARVERIGMVTIERER